MHQLILEWLVILILPPGNFSYNGKNFSAAGAIAGSGSGVNINGFKLGAVSTVGGAIFNSEKLNLSGKFAATSRWNGI